jgi:hypothetical protein
MKAETKGIKQSNGYTKLFPFRRLIGIANPNTTRVTIRSGNKENSNERVDWVIDRLNELMRYKSSTSRAGSSRDSFTRTRKVTASRPSTMR